MSVLALLAGSAVLALIAYDLGSTTMSVSSVQGPLSRRVSALTWRVLRTVSRSDARRALRLAGPLILLLVLTSWLLGLAAGWTLIFSVDGALESSGGRTTGEETSVRLMDAFFFVYGALLGRGSSELSTAEAGWSSVESVMLASGVGVLTLSLAWILPVVQAVVHKRSVAAQLNALGSSPEGLLRQSWNGTDYGEVHLFFVNLVTDIAVMTQRHLAYPVIHYFHSADLRTAIGPRLVSLDEALTIITADDLEDRKLYRSSVAALRTSITDFLDSLEQTFVQPATEPPPVPRIDSLSADGLLAIDQADLDACCEELEARRRLLLGYLHHDGWSWSDVTSNEDEVDDADPDEGSKNSSAERPEDAQR